jgi:hypothetical protein
MREPIDEGDDAGGIEEDLVPFSEGFVGRQNQGEVQLIAARDDLEELIGIVCVMGLDNSRCKTLQSYRASQNHNTSLNLNMGSRHTIRVNFQPCGARVRM